MPKYQMPIDLYSDISQKTNLGYTEVTKCNLLLAPEKCSSGLHLTMQYIIDHISFSLFLFLRHNLTERIKNLIKLPMETS